MPTANHKRLNEFKAEALSRWKNSEPSRTDTEIHADDARGRALRHAIAVAPLRRGGDYFAFDRDEFFGLFHEKLAANAASACNT